MKSDDEGFWLLQDTVEVIKSFMKKNPNAVNFNVIALSKLSE